MKNPFDKEKESEKYECFKSVVEAIDICIERKFPNLFDDGLRDKLKEIKSLQDEILKSFSNHRQAINTHGDSVSKSIINDINEFLKNDYPDLDRRFSLMSIDLEKQIEKINKNADKVDKKLKEIVYHNSISDDVHKLRDEMKDIQKKVEDFTKKIQKAFG